MKLEQRNIEYDERINRYLRGLMGDDERTAFEQEVDGNEELRERLVSTSLLVQGIVEEGIQREGQSQLDAIKKMSPEEFEQVLQDRHDSQTTIDRPEPSIPRHRPALKFIKWATGIAAIGIIALCLPVFYTIHNNEEPVVAYGEVCDTTIEIESPITIKQPTLASLAKEYNKPIAGEPDEFVAIREQIQNEEVKDMMAVVYDIDKIQAPTHNEGAMGAENAEVIKEMRQMHNDCTHWYKALAFLKKGDKDSAIKELNNLKEHGSNEDLVKRATALLKKLEK